MASIAQASVSHAVLSNRSVEINKAAVVASAAPGKGAFFGTPLLTATSAASKASSARSSVRLQVTARKTATVTEFEAEVDKPLGLLLGSRPGGGVQITAVIPGSNAAKAGLKTGDQVIYTSSFFGDELWVSDNLGFTQTAVNAKKDSVYFVVARGGAVDVKKLRARPAPPRFGRKLTEAQKKRATHICLDCGYIYTLPKPFEEQPASYECPQCSAPKSRFAGYDPETGRAVGGGSAPLVALLSVAVGAGLVGALLFLGLQ